MRFPTPPYLPTPPADFLALLKTGRQQAPGQRGYGVVPFLPPGLFDPSNLAAMLTTASYGPEAQAAGNLVSTVRDLYKQSEAEAQQRRAEEQRLLSELQAIEARDVPYRQPKANWWEIAIPALAMIVASPGKKGPIAEAAAQYFGGRLSESQQRYQMEQERLERARRRHEQMLNYIAQDRRALEAQLPELAIGISEAMLKKTGIEQEAQRAARTARLEERRLAEAERKARAQERRWLDQEFSRILRDEMVDENYNRVLVTPGTDEERQQRWEQFIDSLVALLRPFSDEDPTVLREMFQQAFPLLPYGQLSLKEQRELQRIKSSEAQEKYTLARLRRLETLLPYEVAIYDERGKLLKLQTQWYPAEVHMKLKLAEARIAEARKRMQNIDSMIKARGRLDTLAIAELSKASLLFGRTVTTIGEVLESLEGQERDLYNKWFITPKGTAESVLLEEQLQGVRANKQYWQERQRETADMSARTTKLLDPYLPRLKPKKGELPPARVRGTLKGGISWELVEP